jgi:hypothetical protein
MESVGSLRLQNKVHILFKIVLTFLGEHWFLCFCNGLTVDGPYISHGVERSKKCGKRANQIVFCLHYSRPHTNSFFFFFLPPVHIIQYFPVQALYPEPCTRPYGIRIYRHISSLWAMTAGRFRPTRPATVVGKACFLTFWESGLSPLDIVCTP